jgi:CRISPR/Cas system CMR-associated protein Cmr5 small subunit
MKSEKKFTAYGKIQNHHNKFINDFDIHVQDEWIALEKVKISSNSQQRYTERISSFLQTEKQLNAEKEHLFSH